MFNPALQRFYKSNNPNASHNNSANMSLDTKQVTDVAQILKDQKQEKSDSMLTLSTPVLFNIRKDTNIAVVFGDTQDLQKLSCVQTALSQTNNIAGVFAESEALYHKTDETSLNQRSVNIDKIDLSKVAPNDAALIFEAIVALSNNNSFRKTKLPEQFQSFIENNAHINAALEANKLT